MKKHFQSVISLIMFLALIALVLIACTPPPNSVPDSGSPPPNPSIPSEPSTPPESSGVSGPNAPPESAGPYVSEAFPGVWQYEYGDRNFAQIRIYNETEEGFDFHLFVVEYDQEGKITQGGFSTYAQKGSDGKASYSAGEKESSNNLKHVEGTITINNRHLNTTYNNLQSRPYDLRKRTQLPTSFEKVSVDQTKQAMYELPFFTREIVGFPLDLTIEQTDKLFGPLLDVETVPEYEESIEVIMNRKYADTKVSFYYPDVVRKNNFFFSIETAHPGISFVRDIQIGDTLESVIAKFPNEKNGSKSGDNDKIQTLYGKAQYLDIYGYVWYGKNGQKNIWYSDGGKIFKLEFDASDHVSKITLSNASD